MAHSGTQPQQFQYRYRPNATTRPTMTNVSNSCHDMEHQSSSPTSYSASQLTNSLPSKLNEDIALTHSYMQATSGTDGLYGATFATDFVPMDHAPFAFPNGFQPMDFSPLPSPHAPSWVSSDSSNASESCSGSWSSPTSSMSFSPEPQYQIPLAENASWPPQNHNPYFSADCVSMQEVFQPFDMNSEFVPNPIYYPPMPQSWQYQYIGDNVLPVYETTEYCSSRGSPDSVPEQASRSSDTVVTVKPLPRESTADASTASSPSEPIKERESASPQPRSKSQFEGQILEFSSPVAQAKTKGPKSAALPCPLAAYGCTSSFISKNEWKRHINTQHLRLEAWLCDQCPKRDNKREFNRKDLFIQHLKRMHPSPCAAHSQKLPTPKSKAGRTGSKGNKATKPSKGDDLDPALSVAEQRCHMIIRQPPADSTCLFCPTNFSGRGSWEARIEHVAKHMEQYKKEGNDVPDPKTWRTDRALEQWLVSERVISKVRQRWNIV